MKSDIIAGLCLLSAITIMICIAIAITQLITRVLPKLGDKSQARLRHWSKVAQDLGLEYSDALGHGSMRGVLHGIDVEFKEHPDYSEDTSPQNRNPTGRCWSFRARLPDDAPAELSIARERVNVFLSEDSKLSKFLKPREVELDDPAFDKTFFIKARDEDEARAYLAPAHRREALMELSGLGAIACGISSGYLTCMLKSSPIDAELEPIIQQLLDIAHHHIHGRHTPPAHDAEDTPDAQPG